MRMSDVYKWQQFTEWGGHRGDSSELLVPGDWAGVDLCPARAVAASDSGALSQAEPAAVSEAVSGAATAVDSPERMVPTVNELHGWSRRIWWSLGLFAVLLLLHHVSGGNGERVDDVAVAGETGGSDLQSSLDASRVPGVADLIAPGSDPERLDELLGQLLAVQEQLRDLSTEIEEMRLEHAVWESPSGPGAIEFERLKQLIEAIEPSAELRSIPERLACLEQAFGGLQQVLSAGSGRWQESRVGSSSVPRGQSAGLDLEDITGDDLMRHLGTLLGTTAASNRGRAERMIASLRSLQPTDARFWYASAVNRGYATRDWWGETQVLAKRGAECERAGVPDAAAVEEFLDLLAVDAATWLNQFRGREGQP
jgi:hypothetical protein